MNNRVTIWLALLALAVPLAKAQTDVTIREINAISQTDIDVVKALGAAVTEADIIANIRSPYDGQQVRFDAVVLSDPRYSGLSSDSDGDGFPSRVHYFVRDTSAVTEGPAGHDIQVVDGDYQTTGSLNLFVGDVVRFTGNVAYFGTGLQFSPQSIELLGSVGDPGLPDASILDPVTITVDQLNIATSDTTVRLDWDSFNTLNQQYVRIEGLQVWQSPNRTADRPNYAMRDESTGSIVESETFSLAYRNDQTTYATPPFASTDEFVAPPPGATVDIQGFAILSRSDTFDPFNMGDPIEATFKIAPWLPADLVITQTPPNIANLMNPDGVIGNTAATVAATVKPDPTRSLAKVVAVYSTTSNPMEMEVSFTHQVGDTLGFDIPAQPDGDFVTWRIEATDDQGAKSTSPDLHYRVLWNGIQEISHIQQTVDGGPGDSPFKDLTTAMDLEVTVQTDPANAGGGSSDLVAVQDGTGPWSGISLRNSGTPLVALAPGDVIRITEATVVERFGLTRLRDFTFEVVSQGGQPYDPIVVTTLALQDEKVAEAHEGMYVRVEGVTIVDLAPDAIFSSCPCGEFRISSDGTLDNAIRVDDQSTGVTYTDDDPATVFSEGETLEFVQGTLWYSFDNYKIEPATFDDIGPVINVSTETSELPYTTTLHQNFPNPFNPSTAIRYDVATTGRVTLAVYDALGRKVATLVDGERAAGVHEVQFDASRLASGLYLYQLSTADRTVARTMTLLK